MAMKKEGFRMDIISLQKKIKEKKVSPTEITTFYLEKIKKENEQLNAFITVCEKEALEAAEKATEDIMKGRKIGPLHGIPIAIKDMIFTKDVKTTLGSKLYENFIPDKDASVVKKLKEAGAIIVGKTNTHEFAYGPVGDRSFFGPVHNPHDLNKITGGSSSGSGAAVSAELCVAALGTDTGGSVRIPASACGIVGMKPSFGRVSKYGAFPLSYTLDHIGPMTKTVQENALLLNILSGYDQLDDSSITYETEDFMRLIGTPRKQLKIGIPSFYFNLIADEVKQSIEKVIHTYEELGAKMIEVDLDFIDDIIHLQKVVIQSEAYEIHEKNLQTSSNDMQKEVRERLEESKEVRGFEYVKAIRNRKQWIQKFEQVFNQVDVLLTPTLPITPPNIFEREVIVSGNKEAVIPILLRNTSPTNYLGNPSISIPCGYSKGNLPIGFQLIGEYGSEAKLYQVAAMFEQTIM